ncbi:MAG: putative selenoprotein [Planctomycetes bacterium]|nr:putative selenoprotein [Planctomycetota bacterium]
MRRLLAVLSDIGRRTSDVGRSAYRLLRWWSGDDAYERYLAEHAGHDHRLLSRRAFYRAYFDRRGNRPRCC